MIVTDYGESFRMITQYQHSHISGLLAKEVDDRLLKGLDRKRECVLAITEHDRAWLPLDEKPSWNNEAKQPHSFIDYPLYPKIKAYVDGIDEVEKKSAYAAYLCSLHYIGFFKQNPTDTNIKAFLNHEYKRRRRISAIERVNEHDEEIQFHLKLLKFFDSLSLYLCLNKEGSLKEEEVNWYRNGFAQRFFWNNDERIVANWFDSSTIGLSFFPFVTVPTIELHYKMVSKEKIKHIGIAKAYYETPFQTKAFSFKKQHPAVNLF